MEDDEDRAAWVAVLGEACEGFGWRVHAWCLMTNHYHLLVETPQGNLSAGMRQLNGVWAQCFNQRHGRVGHVFQGRYKAIMVEKESYLLELSRYVVLNPVRVGKVADAADYPWSSYPAMLARSDQHSPVPHPTWLETDFVLRQFGAGRRRAAPDALRHAAPRQMRDAAMAEIYARGHHTLCEIAEAFGVHEATVCRAVRRAEAHGPKRYVQ